MVTLYNAISADGFIAREDGGEDFIPDALWDYFIELCGDYDTWVMGRKTYDAIGQYDHHALEKFEDLSIRKVVVTRDDMFVPAYGCVIACSPREACALGNSVLLTSGPTLNTAALNEGLVDKIIVNVLPVTVGVGIAQFEQQPNVRLISEKYFPDGITLVEYDIIH